MNKNGYQIKRLAKLLINLRSTNKFYGKYLINCSDEVIYENAERIYNELPIMSKQNLINNYSKNVSYEIRNGFENDEIFIEKIFDVNDLSSNHDKIMKINGIPYKIETTSGTSGYPFPIIKSYEELLKEATYLYKCRKSIYSDVTIDNGFLLIHPIDEVIKSINHRGYNNESFEKLFLYLIEKKPKWIFSGANLIKRFATFIENYDVNSKMKEVNLKFIETTSQKLSEQEVELVERVFHTKIINNYGCREAWNIAYECICGRYHVNNEYLIVDLVDDDGNIINNDNTVGNVIITNLNSTEFPLVKYAIGDIATFNSMKCKCNKSTPSLVLQEGRKNEVLKNSQYYGTTVFRKILRRIYFHDEIKDIRNIRIIQDGEFHLSVYLDKQKKYDDIFEKKFREQALLNIENFNDYQLSFIYNFPFNTNVLNFKDIIFVSKL